MPRQFRLTGKWRLLQKQREEINPTPGDFCGWLVANKRVASEAGKFFQLVLIVSGVGFVVAFFNIQPRLKFGNSLARGFQLRLAVNGVKIKPDSRNRVVLLVEKDFGGGVQVRMELFFAASLRCKAGAPFVIHPALALGFCAKNRRACRAVRDGVGDPTRIELIFHQRAEPLPQLFDT